MDEKTSLAPSRRSPLRNRSEDPLAMEFEWQRRAEQAISELADRGLGFTSADVVRKAGAPPSSNLVPALIRAAHRRGLITKRRDAFAGSEWIGTSPAPRPNRIGAGRRREDLILTDELWRAAQRRAADENVSTGEVMVKALRQYLAGRTDKSREV